MIGFLEEGCAMKYEYEMESIETATPIKYFSSIL